jgi:hypothetical protein
MPVRMSFAGSLATLGLAVTALVCLDVSNAFAQSASCDQLNANLQALSRSRDFRNVDQTSADARSVQADERNAESAYIRTGCQQAQQQNQPQTPECRGLARQILQGRAQIQQLSQSLANGNAVAQQREGVLQQIARFGCNDSGSQARFIGDPFAPPPRRRNFLDNLFGGFQRGNGDDGYGDQQPVNGQDQVDDPFANGGGDTQNTIRTVCVRLSDGYYWPVSYATVRDYIPQDAQTCLAQCPGQQVELYFYDNPGQEPEQMVDTQGQAYTALATAFAYRKAFDRTNTCKPQESFGQIALEQLGDGQARAMITFNDLKFPLPLRDPRRTEQATTAPVKIAQVIDIPLPRPRPSATAAAPAVAPATGPVVSSQNRMVKVGDKVVRIVGPDTPYAPATAAGT